jgi:hypothetical protein
LAPAALTVTPMPTVSAVLPDAVPLSDLIPVVATLPDADNVRIGRSWNGLSPTAPYGEQYVLGRDGDRYVGPGRVTIGSRSSGSPGRDETREVVIPADEMRRFLEQLAAVSVVERAYTPTIRWTDDYPEITIAVTVSDVEVRFMTKSQGPGNLPWGVVADGRTFVVSGDTIPLALDALEPFLLRGLQRDLFFEVNEEIRRNAATPTPANQPPV